MKVKSVKQIVSFSRMFCKHPLIRVICEHCEQISLKIGSNGVILIKFTHVLENGLLHITDPAATAGSFTTTAAGSKSSSNFTSACRRRHSPLSDLKLANGRSSAPQKTICKVIEHHKYVNYDHPGESSPEKDCLG